MQEFQKAYLDLIGGSYTLTDVKKLASLVRRTLDTQKEWESVFSASLPLRRRITPKGVEMFLQAIENTLSDQSSNYSPKLLNKELEARERRFKEGLEHPHRFRKEDLLEGQQFDLVEESSILIEEDYSKYKDRENEFRSRVKDPGSFRRRD